MPQTKTTRWAALLAGLWGGMIFGIGAVGAPSSFAVASSAIAGQVAGRMFANEARLSLALCVISLILVRRQAQSDSQEGRGSVFSTNLLLVLGALFCTMFGYYAILPMMAAAKAGQGVLSFGALHGISAGSFVLKGLLVLTLAWRLSAR